MARKLLTKADKDRARQIANYRNGPRYVRTDWWTEVYYLYLQGVADGRRSERKKELTNGPA